MQEKPVMQKALEAKSGIYVIRHIDSEKLYVGSAMHFKKRWNRHITILRQGVHDNVNLQRAWNLYGADRFEFSVIEYVADNSTLIDAEQKWIDKLDAFNSGYNLLPKAGSRLGSKHSEEAKKRISEGGKGKKRSDETKAKMSIAFSGRTMSESARAKISASRKLAWQNEEYRAKQIAKRKGIKQDPAAIAKREATKAANRQQKTSQLN